jgi:hypothetical protein
MKFTRRVVPLVLASVAALAAGSVRGAQGPLRDDWYAIYLMGQKAGYQHEVVVEETGSDGPLYSTLTHTEFSIQRAGAPMKLVMESIVREDADGEVQDFRHRLVGAMSLFTQGHREGDQMVLSSRTGGLATSTRLPAHDGLGPWALSRLRERMGHEPGTVYTCQAFVPDAPGTPVGYTVTIAGQEDVQIFEVKKRLNRADEVLSIMGGLTSSEWSDDSGTVWRTTIAMPGDMVLECRKTTKDMATAPDDPAEILAASYVRPNKPIPHPRTLDRLRLLVRPLSGDASALGLESGPFQEVESTADGVLVTLTRAVGDPARSYKLPYAGSEYAEFQKPNVWMESEDPLVVQMTKEAVGRETDALKAARRIEAYVRKAITSKNLSVGFATAAEAAAQRSGDCTEHAVLAAAMARAAGMPSRVVGGLVYVDQLPGARGGGFGYHLWTEVYVGEWLPIDGALGAHDATHLALVRSALNGPDDLFTISAAISRVFGGIALDVIETE